MPTRVAAVSLWADVAPKNRHTAVYLIAVVAAPMLMACYLVQALQPNTPMPDQPASLPQAIETPTAFTPSPAIIPTETVPDTPTHTPSISPEAPTPSEFPVTTTPEVTETAIPITPTLEPTPDDQILWSDASEYLGEERSVCGPVAGTHFADSSRGKPTFLNIGEDYPSPDRFVVLIWGEYRDNFPRKPEKYYEGVTICAEGEIQEYEGIFEIEVRSPADIEIQP